MEINSKICKVCHCPDSQDNPLCFPCKCNGSIKYIHKECLFLYIESSNKTFCTICKYKYILKDIFKPDTPEKVPFKLILKGIYDLLVKYLIKIGSNLLTLTILILIILVNGYLMLISSDGKYLFTSYFGILSVIFFGILTTFFSNLNFYFFKNLSAYLEQVLNRRVIRIDPLSAMNSIATDLISMTDSEIDGTARTLLSTITQRLRYEEERDEMPMITTRERVVNNPVETQEGGDQDSNNQDDRNPIVIQPNDNEPLINNEHLNNSIDNNDPSSFTTSSEDSFITQSTPSSFTPINFYSILKGINISLIWWFVSKIYSFTPFTFTSYFIFLKDVYLDIITQKFLILYLLVFSLMSLLKVINPKSISFSIIKIYHLGILSLFFFIYFQGVCVHYAFSNILNNNLPVLSLESSYFKDYKTLLSLVFHLILGYSVTSLIKKTLDLFKNKFRRGVLWFIVEPSNNDFTYLTQMASENPFTSIFRFLLRGITTLLLAKYIFYILRGANIFILSITSVNKALLLFKLMDLVSEPFSFFNKQVANLINHLIYLISRILKLSNYLYGDTQKVDKSDLKRFKWLPNTHKYYKQSTVKRKFNKKVTVEDLEKYFNKKRVSGEVGVGDDSGELRVGDDSGEVRVGDDGIRGHDEGDEGIRVQYEGENGVRVHDEGRLTNNSPNNTPTINNNNNTLTNNTHITNNPLTTTTTYDFSIFFTPSYFKLRLSLISFISLTLYVTFYFSLFRFSYYVGSFLQIEKFFNNSSDVILIVISGSILQGLRLILYLLKRNKNIVEDLISFTKSFILLVFSLVIWPLWSTFIILVLYSEPLRSIYPGRLISLLFSSSSIVTFILNKVLFLRPIRNYSFSVIFKKLYGFISIMTFLIICISLLRSYSFIVIIETSEIPFLLIFGISAVVFYLKHCIKVMYSNFIENIKREHYLVDRNVENYESGE